MNFSIKKAVLLSAASLALFTSCRDDNNNNNNNGGGNMGSGDVISTTTYEFSRDGESTVNVSGQHQRIDMHSVVKYYADAAKDQDITVAHLMALVQNSNSPFVDGQNEAFYSASDLNGSGKQIWNKLGASASVNQADVYAHFQELFAQLEALSGQRGQTASDGVAGMMGTRLVDDKGIEVIQVMSKSMMGALELDQILNHYLSDDKLNVDNTNMVEGKNYTSMEHHWDEAFGYTGLPADPSTNISDDANKSKYRRFWSNYINAVNNSVAGDGIKQQIYDAFIKGRGAIVNKNYVERDAQRDKIRELLQKVCLIRAVHYLRDGAAIIEDPAATTEQKASAFHAASEGLGFLYAVDFTPIGQSLPPNHKASSYLAGARNLGFYEGPQSANYLKQIANVLAQYGGFNVADA